MVRFRADFPSALSSVRPCSSACHAFLIDSAAEELVLELSVRSDRKELLREARVFVCSVVLGVLHPGEGSTQHGQDGSARSATVAKVAVDVARLQYAEVSGSCNVSVDCPADPPWNANKQSVVQVRGQSGALPSLTSGTSSTIHSPALLLG